MLPLFLSEPKFWSPSQWMTRLERSMALLLVWRTESTESAFWCDIKPPGQKLCFWYNNIRMKRGQISTPASFFESSMLEWPVPLKVWWHIAQMGDMDEEERGVKQYISGGTSQNSLHKMFYVPKDEERPNEKCDTRRNKLGMKQKGRWRRTEWRDGCHLASPTWKFIHCDSISQKPWWHENSLALVEKLTTREREE